MKTKRKIFIQFVNAAFIALVTFGIQSCETEIPPEDPTPPTFIFRITGDGFTHDFTQDSDFDNIQLNLKDGVRYNYILSAGDQGGTDRIQWFVPGNSNLAFEEAIYSPWTIRNISPLQRLIAWRGDRSNPLTGSILSGHFTIRGGNIADTFRFRVVDFGGEGRRPNEVEKWLNIYIGNHPTEIINL